MTNYRCFQSRDVNGVCDLCNEPTKAIHLPVRPLGDPASTVVEAADAVGIVETRPQLRPGDLQTRGNRRGAAVEGVEAVGVDVVRQPAGAAAAGDEDDLLARHAEPGEDVLELGKDREIAAAGAPAHLLVGGEVVRRQQRQL